MHLEMGAARHHFIAMAAKNTRLDRILSGTDPRAPEYILKMFEVIKGRKPTPEERARLQRQIPTIRDAKR
jgi:hypothetical protein